MSIRDSIMKRYTMWDGDPCTEPDGDLESALDDYDAANELSEDDD